MFKKLVPSEGGNPKDTLYWEFSKEISQAIDDSVDIVYVTLVNELVSQVISNLQIDEIVKKF